MPQALISWIERGIETAKGIRIGLGAIHKAQDILATFDIDLIKTKTRLCSLPADELHNMSYAINSYKGIHSKKYADAVLAKLEDAVADGASYADKRQRVIDALADMRRRLEKGESFW